MKQVYNPFLIENEYIPDAEPRIFNNRIYIYGSHDLFNGNNFCLGDYVTYSCPIDDLSNWRYEGIIYKKEQDPLNKKKKAMYALIVFKELMAIIIYIIVLILRVL